MIYSQDRYVREVYYDDKKDAVNDIMSLLNGLITVDALRMTIEANHVADEHLHGVGMYKKEDK